MRPCSREQQAEPSLCCGTRISLELSVLRLPVPRYGYHVSKTSYVVCDDPPTIRKIFNRLRNFDGEGSYPKACGGVQVLHVRDVTTGYDSSRPDLRCVRREHDSCYTDAKLAPSHRCDACVV